MSFGIEIYDFITDQRNEDSVIIDDYGNATFEASIEYKFRSQTLQSKTNVKITRNGYDDGKVSLDENDELNVNLLHLDFTPDYQEYKYDSNDNNFKITGSSPKMSGDYLVEIKIL